LHEAIAQAATKAKTMFFFILIIQLSNFFYSFR